MHEQQITASSLRFFHPDKVLRMVIKFAESVAKNEPANHDNPFGGATVGGGALDNSMVGRIVMGAGYSLSSDDEEEAWERRSITSLPPIEDMSVLKGDGWAFLFVFSGTSFVRIVSEEVQGWTFLKVNKEAYDKWLEGRLERARGWEIEQEKAKTSDDQAEAHDDGTSTFPGARTTPIPPPNPHRHWR